MFVSFKASADSAWHAPLVRNLGTQTDRKNMHLTLSPDMVRFCDVSRHVKIL